MIKKKLVIKVVETKTQNMIEKCLEMTAYEAQLELTWVGPIRVLKSGCLPILVICRRYRNLGFVAQDSVNCIK